MLEKTYKNMNSQITASPGLIADTIDLMNGSGEKSRVKEKPVFRRPVAVAAAIALCLALATPVLAANVPAIYDLMYLVSPAVAQYFVPVQESCENNGVRMEVVSTHIYDDTAEIYVTMRDLTGDRVDETTDLFDSYSLHIPFDSISHCERVGFDETTHTATFLITISTMDGNDIDTRPSKVTFSIGEFLSHKAALENVPVDVDLSGVSEADQTQMVYANGFSGINAEPYRNESGEYTALVPGASLCTPINGLDVTAVGYIDGMLHIQSSTADKLTYDTHGYFYLVDEDGNQIQYDYSVSFFEGEINGENRVDYQEFIFDIPQNELRNHTLYGSFYTSGQKTEGNWRVTFPLTAG